MLIKCACDSFAIAFAINVLPQPGGPYNNIPALLFILNRVKSCGVCIGRIIELYRAVRVVYSAPISSNVTSGIAANPSRSPVG